MIPPAFSYLLIIKLNANEIDWVPVTGIPVRSGTVWYEAGFSMTWLVYNNVDTLGQNRSIRLIANI